MLTWLADVLRGAGLKVVERPGWKTRGNGKMGTAKGVLCHHTGAGSRDGLLNLIERGRADLAGPLSQLFLDTDGTYYVIAAGRCNHAGRGNWQGVTNGNTQLIGIEACNAGDGKDVWEEEQLDAYVIGVAAILTRIGADSVMVAGHKEYALPRGRKIDPTFDMVEFRQDVENVMSGKKVTVVTTVDPTRDMLRKGDSGASVRELQKLLKITADGNFGPNTEKAVKKFQAAHGLVSDGLVGPRTWKELEDE